VKSPYLRSFDRAKFEATPLTERVSSRLIDRDSGATSCQISYIRTPPGGGSPRGLHTHDVDQHIFVVSGTMSFKVGDEVFEAGPGSLVYYPAGTPHENWNAGTEPTVHLSINSPLPQAGESFEKPV
jgi:quercetin dioxygenase-like cupin family protein